MLKASYIITLLGGIGIFNSCTGNFINLPKHQEYTISKAEESLYGNYLAGRVAHIRQEYDVASKYYVKTIERGFVNDDILNKTYIILASQGNIDEAVKYANMSRDKGDKNNFIDVINAVHLFKQNNYKDARKQLERINEKTYKNLISPLFNAWSYVGENNYNKATNELQKISSAEEMKTVYNLHRGLVAEIFGYEQEAEGFYNKIINDKTTDMSFRALQIISNFLVRQGQKEKALSLITKYYGSSNMKEMLSSLSDKIKSGDERTSAIVKTADIGVSEVFLEVALLFKAVPVGYDYAQMYMAISQYFNPNNDIAKIAMADICEERQMYNQANKYYDSISKKSEMYYPAQIKKANNLSNEKKYDAAVKVLKKLLRNNPNNFQILSNLGDILRMSNNQPDAIKYYKEALKSIFYESEKHWPLYYALAVSYDRNNEWNKAEENLKKALDLSNRHPQVLNYLGYSWLKNNINVDKAASLILEAYEKEPNDGIIMDSLGWVYFKTGDYKNAISYLEKASELNPQNAIISDHLGDAYWLGGRKNEAIFLWKQSLHQKENQEELNPRVIKHKIQNGLKNIEALQIKDEKLKQSLHSLNDIAD
ncbi:MAG: tetratricopeptide repeat protein [Alphaproteobacteria bacterium]|nr:tetratricopeptide repeat protein [Alphaproteobacteria bacterium]